LPVTALDLFLSITPPLLRYSSAQQNNFDFLCLAENKNRLSFG
jgi:hypothetical protein